MVSYQAFTSSPSLIDTQAPTGDAPEGVGCRERTQVHQGQNFTFSPAFTTNDALVDDF